MPLFVTSPGLHTLFRFVAAFLVAPYLLYVGWKGTDLFERESNPVMPLIFAIGLGTLLIDSWTFFLSLRKSQ